MEPQILLKVKFADVDPQIGASQSLGINIASAALGQDTGITTGQFGNAGIDQTGTFSLSQALNILLFRKDLNLGATIQALESKNLLEMLSEPNVLAINGQTASFLSGGQFPVPMVQGNTALGTVTIAFKEYGIRLTFTPNLTPRGTIRLKVNPESEFARFRECQIQISGFDCSRPLHPQSGYGSRTGERPKASSSPACSITTPPRASVRFPVFQRFRCWGNCSRAVPSARRTPNYW